MEDKATHLTKKELGKNVNLKGTIKKAEKHIKTQDKDLRYNNFLQKEATGWETSLLLIFILDMMK